MNILKKLSILFLSALVFTACSNDDDPEVVNEEELITTVTATFVPDGGGNTIELKSQDLDGDGGNAPVVTVSGNFQQNKIYRGSVTFKNEFVNPAEDITVEIAEEGDEHQIFYVKTGTLNTLTYGAAASNLDVNGLPIGLQSVFTTTGVATGTLTIVLRHEPNKNAAGVSTGDITNAGGSTDASVTFNIIVE